MPRITMGMMLFVAIASGTTHAASIDLDASLDDVASATFTVLSGNKPVCELSKPADGKLKATSTCRFEFDPRTTTWQVKGSYRLPSVLARGVKGEQTIKVLDFGVATKHLAPSDKPYGERMAAFIEATNRFVHQHIPDYPDLIDARDAANAKAIDAAAKRLEFPLPPDFVAMQRRVGALRIGDHSVMPLDEIHDAYTQMLKVWGTPEEGMQSDYSREFQTVLRHSTLLFTEVGDGYGGLLYRPGKTKTCGEGGTYYWTSQEGGTEVITHADGRCMDFAAAMRWVLNDFVVDEVADYVADELTDMVDSSVDTLPVQLSVQTGDTFAVTLRASWPGPYR